MSSDNKVTKDRLTRDQILDASRMLSVNSKLAECIPQEAAAAEKLEEALQKKWEYDHRDEEYLHFTEYGPLKELKAKLPVLIAEYNRIFKENAEEFSYQARIKRESDAKTNLTSVQAQHILGETTDEELAAAREQLAFATRDATDAHQAEAAHRKAIDLLREKIDIMSVEAGATVLAEVTDEYMPAVEELLKAVQAIVELNQRIEGIYRNAVRALPRNGTVPFTLAPGGFRIPRLFISGLEEFTKNATEYLNSR